MGAQRNSNDVLLAVIWHFLRLSVHKYKAGITGEILVVMTIVIMDRTGHHPTVSELVSILDLPKSTVSRYIADQISVGHLEEVTDNRDRRRRILIPTKAGRKEFNWVDQQIAAIAELANSKADLFEVLKHHDDSANAVANQG